MQKLTVEEIVNLINKKQIFEATSTDNSFRIKINRYVPYCCMAIHDGSNLRPELADKINVDDYQRWYEEDPHTGNFIDSLPITLVGLDSRFEYDLNRRPEECIFDEAWGQKVWKKKLTPKERQLSLRKHQQFYKVVYALVAKLNHLYQSCIVFDIHSYNYKRWDREVPLFNIGAEKVDAQQFNKYVNHWQKELAEIELTGIENTTAVNDVFYGRGYNLEFISQNFNNVLVLATEVKKVYCNELTGEDYPEVIRELQHKLKEKILNTAQYYSQENTTWHHNKLTKLLDKKKDKAVFEVDRKLYRLVKNFELLAHVNPTNSTAEYKRFVRSKYTEPPKFKYAPIKIDPFELKQQLSSLRVNDISDVSIKDLYESVINSLFDKIDLLASLDSKKFLYNSLRYFGRPSKQDLINAQYLLYLPEIQTEPKRVPSIKAQDALEYFREGIDAYGIRCKIELSNKVISQVMVLNSKNTVLVRPDARFTQKEARALVEHEIGVHMVTTQNSRNTKLKVFGLGLPVNTLTQEGLAILAEYLSGNITLKRLKKIALRVVITDMMCNGADFKECYHFLVNQYNIASNDAYTIVTRIFRGGGFTKDYLYLRGFVEILKFYRKDESLLPLLVGKTSIDFYDTIKEMMERELVETPQLLTKSFSQPAKQFNTPVYDYIISGLK